MKEKLLAIEKNKTWELVTLPEGKEIVGLKWIYKIKYNSNQSIQRHKANLVAKGTLKFVVWILMRHSHWC